MKQRKFTNEADKETVKTVSRVKIQGTFDFYTRIVRKLYFIRSHLKIP